MITLRIALRSLLAAALAASCLAAWSDDAAIRKSWADRNPRAPAIDEISKTPVAGLYELRVGAEIVYSDDQGNYLIFPSRDQADGHIIDSRSKADLTQQRIDRMMAIEVPRLPFNDALVFKQGTGARRLVVFEDPNCHFCKDVEKNLVSLKDVTIYTFLIPILGPDSVVKSRNIWCSRDNAKSWRSWMLAGVPPQREMGNCDVATLNRNLALADRFRINGTPAIIFEDGSRFAGAADLERLQKQLDQAGPPKKG